MVGFDTKGEGKIIIKEPNYNTFDYTISDNREGWSESLRLLLNAYFKSDPLPIFNYSEIRPEGTLIKTFGGKCPGYKPLEDLHKGIMEKDRKSVV